MLKNTYIHIPSIGHLTEKKIWGSGISSWESFDADKLDICSGRKKYLKNFVDMSISALDKKDHLFFSNHLPKDEHWRALPDFKDIAYLDIETTGLDKKNDDITLIGVYDGNNVKTFVRGKEFNEFKEYIKSFPMIVTFNGSCFDLPFISSKLNMDFDQLHVDLRFAFKNLGISGGLKNIERRFGLARSSETEGMDGLDAVRLWYKYINGDNSSLELLKKYNSEDVVNLKALSEKAYSMLRQKLID